MFKNFVKGWLKNFLGVSESERRISRLEEEKTDLEARVVDANRTRQLVRKSVDRERLTAATEKHLTDFGISVPPGSTQTALQAMEVAQAVEVYGLRRFVPPVQVQQPSEVISMKDLQEHPERYLHKLKKGFLTFPLGLNFEEINQLLSRKFGNIQISTDTTYSPRGALWLTLDSLLRSDSSSDRDLREAEGFVDRARKILDDYSARMTPSQSEKTRSLMINAEQRLGIVKQARRLRALMSGGINHADLNLRDGDESFHIDTLDFLANYDGIQQMVVDHTPKGGMVQMEALQALQFVRFCYLTALETVGTTRIKDPSELLGYAGSEQRVAVSGDAKEDVRRLLLTDMKGTTYHDIQKLLSIRSREEFRRLASERTLEILARDKERKGLTAVIGKPFEEYTIGEYVVLACYFARNIIQRYKKPEDAAKAIISGIDTSFWTSGRCSDYTGLAVHYLREHLSALYPERFTNWTFGFDADEIGSYNHCYMKIMHMNPDKTLDVYFVDPTALAQKGVKALQTPEKVMEAAGPSRLPLEIQRDAEDLLHNPIA